MKRKPDQVHVFRLELQQKERELLDSYTTAYAVKSWSEPVVNILRDVTATLTVIGILILLLGDKLDRVLQEGWKEITSQLKMWPFIFHTKLINELLMPVRNGWVTVKNKSLST